MRELGDLPNARIFVLYNISDGVHGLLADELPKAAFESRYPIKLAGPDFSFVYKMCRPLRGPASLNLTEGACWPESDGC